MPDLPFDLTYAAVGAAALALVGAIVQQVFADQIKAALATGWRRSFGRRSSLRRDEWMRYRHWVQDTFKGARLGFLRDTQVAVEDVYVPLQYEKDGKRVDVYRDVSENLRTVVAGPAGAGKSMLLRHSMLRWAAEPQREDRIPVLVDLARLNRDDRTLRDLITDVFTIKPRNSRKPLVKNAGQVIDAIVDRGRLCLFLDGFDEVVTERRAHVADEIKQFAERHPSCQIVVTCRDAVYDGDLRPVFDEEIHMAGFDDAGIRRFLRLWFGRESDLIAGAEPDDVGNAPLDARDLVEQLVAELRANPALMRIARSPLMLTMIASLHDADPGRGPLLTNSRSDFYNEAISHLLRRDHHLGRNRNLARYRASHKRETLCTLALIAQGGDDRIGSAGNNVLTESVIYTAATTLVPRFGLTAADGRKLVDEIVDRSGLLIRIDENNLYYQFTHLTLQEYLASQELADNPERLLDLYRGNPSRWRETVKLWCGGAKSAASSLIAEIAAGDARDRLLALECVAEARFIDEELADRIVDGFVADLTDPQPDKQLVLAALGTVAAERGPIGERLFRRLRDEAESSDNALIVLAESRRREAIEVLSDLAGARPAARTALRRLGELAIPVLARRAAAGSVEAVDDLAAIATPAAATAIAEQLWTGMDVAVRAAHWLASLVQQPEIESELCQFDPAPFQKQNRDHYEWLWQPFAPERNAHVTMGRVGWLLDQGRRYLKPTDTPSPDTRVALGVGAQTRTFSTERIPDGWTQRLREESAAAGVKTGVNTARSDILHRYTPLLETLSATNPESARKLALEVIAANVGQAHRLDLLTSLPSALLIDIVKRLSPNNTMAEAGIRDWQSIGQEPVPPRALRILTTTLATLAGTAVCALLVIGLLDAIRDIYTWLIGEGGSFAFAYPVLLLSTIVLFVWSGKNDNDNILVAAVLTMMATAIAGLLSGVFPVAEYLGWPMALVPLTILGPVTLVVWKWTDRRERAVRNPYRALLKLAGRTPVNGYTVIAARDTSPGTPVRSRAS
ncbi:MAG TPA: NACHT domain-containing protein [Actinoplanes sp.]|nr:NACHT domain-containing protein [Actinoplanes sp.]